MKKLGSIFLLIIVMQQGLTCSGTSSIVPSNKASWDTATWQGAVTSGSDATVKAINTNVGMAAAEAAEIIRQGVQGKSASTLSQAGYTAASAANKKLLKRYYDKTLLTTNWISSFKTWFKSNGRTNPFSNMVELSYTNLLQISSPEDDYITTHLLAAMDTFKNGVNANQLDQNYTAYVTETSSWNPQNYVVINRINNNTGSSFYIFQNNKQIGTLYPGVNAVALYGATLGGSSGAGNDITFVPTDNFSSDGSYNKQYGQWRISFKKSLSGNADDQGGGEFSLGGTDKAYICTEVKTDDIPKGGVQTYQRAQCVNVSSLQQMTLFEITVEEHMTDIFSDPTSGAIQEKKYDFDTVKMFYPSVRSVKPVEYVIIPYLLTDKTVMQDIHDIGNQLSDVSFNVGFDSGAVALDIAAEQRSMLNQALQAQANVTLNVSVYTSQGTYHATLKATTGSKVLFTHIYNLGVNTSSVRTENSLSYATVDQGSGQIDLQYGDSVVLRAAGYKSVAAQNPKVTSWLDVINIVLLALQQNYANYADPSYIKNSIQFVQPIYIFQAAQQADITKPVSVAVKNRTIPCLHANYNNAQIKVATSQFTTSTTLPTADIPTASRLGMGMNLYKRKEQGGNLYIDMNSVSLTTDAMLDRIHDAGIADKYMQWVKDVYNLKVKQSGAAGFTVVGSKNFAQLIVDYLNKDPYLLFVSVKKLPGMYLKNQKGALVYFTMDEFLRSVGTQVALSNKDSGVTSPYVMKPDNQKAKSFEEFLVKNYQLKVTQAASKGYTLTGVSGFAQSIHQLLQNSKAVGLLNMLQSVTLQDTQGKDVQMSVRDFIKNITSQAAGKATKKVKPTSKVANIDQQKKLSVKKSVTKK